MNRTSHRVYQTGEGKRSGRERPRTSENQATFCVDSNGNFCSDLLVKRCAGDVIDFHNYVIS